MMKRDKTLATALVASIGYVLVVGAVSSSRPVEPVSPHEPVHMQVTFAGTSHVTEITDADALASLGMWLDKAFASPRSPFDMRVFAPPTNELLITFASGEQTQIYFSGGGRRTRPAADGAMASRWVSNRVVLQLEGSYYIADELPHYFVENAPAAPIAEEVAAEATDA